MAHHPTTPAAAPEPHGDHDPIVAGPTPEEQADGRRAVRAVLRIAGPLGLGAFVLGSGLAVACQSFVVLPLWLVVAVHGLAVWSEARAVS